LLDTISILHNTWHMFQFLYHYHSDSIYANPLLTRDIDFYVPLILHDLLVGYGLS